MLTLRRVVFWLFEDWVKKAVWALLAAVAALALFNPALAVLIGIAAFILLTPALYYGQKLRRDSRFAVEFGEPFIDRDGWVLLPVSTEKPGGFVAYLTDLDRVTPSFVGAYPSAWMNYPFDKEYRLDSNPVPIQVGRMNTARARPKTELVFRPVGPGAPNSGRVNYGPEYFGIGPEIRLMMRVGQPDLRRWVNCDLRIRLVDQAEVVEKA